VVAAGSGAFWLDVEHPLNATAVKAATVIKIVNLLIGKPPINIVIIVVINHFITFKLYNMPNSATMPLIFELVG